MLKSIDIKTDCVVKALTKCKKAIGIIGGMGPLATADLFRKIVVNTKADNDQEHIKILIDNNTNIPDRTKAIVQNGKSPVPQLVKSATSLWIMGAELLVMPCNTAHYFHSQVQNAVDIPVLNMIEITRNALTKRGVRRAGLLATDGTINSGIYQSVFAGSETDLVLPDTDGQKAVMDMIYNGVKAGKKEYNTSTVKKAIGKMISDGVETLILGCTELPLAADMYSLDYPTCDPTLELARGAIIAANGICI